MSLNETPAPDENGLAELKSQLNAFIARSSITRFESEDIIELIGEGEGIEWIVGQLKSDSRDLDADAITKLLTEIRMKIKPGETSAPGETAAAGTEEAEGFTAEAEAEAGMPDLSRIDLSKLDLSQLAQSLPPGVKLPPGLDLKQLQNLMESPQGKIMSDFVVFCQEKGVDIDPNALNDPRTEELRNEWKSTPRDAFDGKTPDEMLEGGAGGLFPEKIKTFRREEPRVGRNDPCPCGSGKKYKKCCGRA